MAAAVATGAARAAEPLPLLLSVPHAGLQVPEWLQPRCRLSHAEVVADGDEGAAAIYDLAPHVRHHVTTDVARAVLDLNRAADDRRKDGVVKTHTCWDVEIWRRPLDAAQIARLLDEHYHPYHRRLTALAGTVRLGVDCHTMAAHGPPVGPDPGTARPLVCLGDGGGACPAPWADALQACLAAEFGREHVTRNDPFAGGYITRHHGREMPWVQLELSRTSALSRADKRARVLAALTAWCRLDLPPPTRTTDAP